MLQQVLKDSFNMKDAEYHDNQSLMGLEDWDSMNHMIFITNLEQEYSVELSGEEIISLVTIGDVKKILAAKGKAEVL
jgi:acyl carrier protein